MCADRTRHGEQRAAEAEQIELLAEEFHEVDRLQRRHDGLRQRLREYDDECDELQRELAAKRRALRHVRFGLLGLWLALSGSRAEHLRADRSALERAERRHEGKSQLVASLEAELAASTALLETHRPVAELRTQLDAKLEQQRAELEQDAPELAARLAALEEELPMARADLAAAERALFKVREISNLLESARAELAASSRRGVIDALFLDGILGYLVTRSNTVSWTRRRRSFAWRAP